MSTQLSARPLRFACDIASANQLREARSGGAPSARRGESLAVQVGAFLGETIVDDVSNWQTVTLQIRDLTAAREFDPDGALQLSASAAGPFVAPSLAAWQAGTAQHAAIAVTPEEMLLAAGEYGLTLHVTTSDVPAGTILLGFCRLKVIETGLGDGTAPPAAPAGYYNKTEADARFVGLASVKHGSAELTADQKDHAIAFPAAFATAPTCVVVTLEIPAGGSLMTIGVKTITAAGFTVRTGAAVPASGYKVHWRAVL